MASDAGPAGADAKPAGKRKASGIAPDTHKKFKRGMGVDIKSIQDKKLKGSVKHTEKIGIEAIRNAKKAYEWLRPAEGGHLEAEGAEQTWQFQQKDIIKAVGEGAARKAFDLALPELGPYSVSFTRSGRWMAFAGDKGHLALMDWSRAHLATEVQVRETTRDVCVLHNEQFFAAAQRKYVYIYDRRGLEVHCCKEHTEPYVLDFLPHHFLLTSAGQSGVLRYQDTTHGEIVAQHRTKMGPVHAMRQNPANGVMCLGHVNGRVTMWTPNLTTAAMSVQCHLGPVRALAVDPEGRYMATAGVDKQVHVWDLRNTCRRVHSYFSHAPAASLDISQSGLLAVGFGSQVHVWKDALATKAKACYMQHALQGRSVRSVRFCPYEDTLAVGHSGGVSTLLIPGAGEANFDSFVANPFQTTRERREQEVHHLLDKLQPDMIMLNPTAIASVLKLPKDVQKERALQERIANMERTKIAHAKNDAKTKQKGKNRESKKHRKKQDNIIEEKKASVQEAQLAESKAIREKEAAAEKLQDKLAGVPRALHRFHKKGQ